MSLLKMSDENYLNELTAGIKFVGRGDSDSNFKIAQSGICESIVELRRNKPMPTEKKAPSKRELIEPTKGDKRYVRRKADGTFGITVDIGRSPAADRKHSAKNESAQSQGEPREATTFGKDLSIPRGES